MPLSPKQSPILCYVTDRRALAQCSDLPGHVARAVQAGVDWIQLREKDLPAHELLALAQFAVSETGKSSSPARILVNDNLDVALAAGAAGVHLGERSLPVATVNAARVRGVIPKGFLIGASCHSLDAARAAEHDGADYVFFGPVFVTPSKAAFGEPQGINRLADVSRSVAIPVLAIGGVNEENAAECFAAGAAGIAAIRMFQETADLAALVARLRGKE
jgi:thiamine-phosphate pyrophosphorylase